MMDKLRTLYYRIKYEYFLKKVKFGSGVLIKCKLAIKGPGKISVGSHCLFETDPWGGDYITLFTHRPQARILIGDRIVLRGTRFGSHLSITINNDAVLENASIYDSDFHNIDASKRDENFNTGDRQVMINENAYVGCECLCSKGTVLGTNVIMLPGSVTGTKNIPANAIIAGNPARICQ